MRRSRRSIWLRRRVVSGLEVLPGWALNFSTLTLLALWNFTLPGVLSAALVGQIVGFSFNQLMIDRWIRWIEKYGGEYVEDPDSESIKSYKML